MRDLPPFRRAAMIAMAWLPLVHIATIATLLAALIPRSPGWAACAAMAALYLPPPLAARLVQRAAGLRVGRIPVGSPDFLAWWFSAQCQLLFNRLSILEEALRLFPGIYSGWLRLWGARVGRLVFWGPGVAILDRGFVEIGDGAVIGTGVRLNPHLVAPADGVTTLVLAPVRVGAGATVGGYSLLGPGAEIGAGETPPARLLMNPHSRWLGGRRHGAGATTR